MMKYILLVLIAFVNPVFAEAPETWQLSPNAFGPIKIGMSITQAEKATGKKFKTTSGECSYAVFIGGPKDIRLMLNRAVIVRIDVKSPRFSSTLGARVGVAESLVQSLYQQQLTVEKDKYSFDKGWKNLIVKQEGYRIIFSTDGKKVTAIRIGRVPEVEYVEGCG